MADIKETLRQLAVEIRDEHRVGANTAKRVGSLLLAIVNAGAGVDIEDLNEKFLHKDRTDETEYLIKFLGGLLAREGIDTDTIIVQSIARIYDLEVSHVATMFQTIIKDYVSSETFIPGFTGEGTKLYKALNGDWNFEVDNIVVRKAMTIFELIISKIRAVNGGLVISPANGRIKSVSETMGTPTYYVLGIEGDNLFVAEDLVRCQVFTSGQAKYYWVPVSSVTADSILVLKSEFADGVIPAIGDDLIQMGNRTNTARQGLLYLTASEDGKPRFSVMDGVDSTSTVGKSKVILGCLDDMTDTDFPADFQPSGWGLYAMNVFLKGVFLLRNGKSVESEIEDTRRDAQTAKDKADTVTTLFQEFTVAGGLFESKIAEVKGYADDKANDAKEEAISDASGKYNTKSEITTLIRQTKSEINLSVTEEISKVQVGGTNLLRNSGNWRSNGWNGGFGDNGGGYVIDDSVLYNGVPTLKTCVGSGLQHSWLLLENNVEYTYSAMVKSNTSIGSSGSTPLHYHAGYGQYNEGKISIIHDDTSLTPDTWKLIKITFKLTDNADSFRPFFYRGSNADVFYWIANIKLEKGNKATDWTPAPEDVQTQITANTSAIEVNGKGIALKASQEQVNALNGRMSSAEIALRPDNIWLGIKQSVSDLVPTCTKQIDTRSLDVNKYYLVTIRMSTTIPYTITVERSLHAYYGVPPYSTHSDGFSVLCKWQSNGSGWGAIATKRIIQTLEYRFVGSCPVGNISQIHESSEEYIYVRGGSVYNVRVDGNSYTDINLRTDTYTPYPDHPNSSRPGVIDSVTAPVVDLDTKVTEEQVKAGIGITENGITVFGKTISLTGVVSFNSLSGDAQSRITSAQNTANAANGTAGAAQSTANDAVNKANTAQGTANTGVSNASAAQETANDAWKKADNVDSALGTLRNSLGGLAYDNAVTLAKLDSTIIEGGYIKTSLINARAIVTGVLYSEAITSTNLTVTGNSKIGSFRIDNGSLSAEDTPALIGFRYSGNSASLGAGSLVIEKANAGNAIYVSGGAGYISMDVNSFTVTSKNGLVLSPHYSNPNGPALDVRGKIVVRNGSNIYSGVTVEVDTYDCWINGRQQVTFRYVNGILAEWRYR